MKNLIQRFIREEEGQDLVEYAFLIAFIALLVTASLTLTENAINTMFEEIAASIVTP